MANEEQLSILKQGAEVWNKWRSDNREAQVDLKEADLSQVDLRGVDLRHADISKAHLVGTVFGLPLRIKNYLRAANLSGALFVGANLSGAKLQGVELDRADLSEADLSRAALTLAMFHKTNLDRANLKKANLRQAYLWEANLVEADLSEARLIEANFRQADLSRASLIGAELLGAELTEANFMNADLKGADLTDANLRETNLTGADLSEARLTRADFSGAILKGSTFGHAWIAHTTFANLDLSETMGLDDVVHYAPSSISIDTFAHSKGKISEIFLRGCGASDWEIALMKLYTPNLSNAEINKILYTMYDLRATQALQISPLFISYSHADSEFVNKVGHWLAERGIRYWRDIHEMKAGRIEKQIDRAISENPTVLLVLSDHSLKSDWVEHEVRTARGLEKEIGRDVLCPVALDDSWKSSPWPKRIMEQVMEYNILDFSAWKDDSKFDNLFRKLIDGLELFYKGKVYGE